MLPIVSPTGRRIALHRAFACSCRRTKDEARHGFRGATQSLGRSDEAKQLPHFTAGWNATRPGMQLIARSSATAQFVLFGEEHGVKEFPELLTALFAFLHQNHQ